MHKDTNLNPLLEPHLRYVPTTLLITCDYDALRDDGSCSIYFSVGQPAGVLFVSALRESGVYVTWHNMMGAPHYILNKSCATSRDMVDKCCQFVSTMCGLMKFNE